MKKSPGNKIHWTKEMEKVISDNWKTKTDKELGDIFGVSKQSVEKKRIRMGLNKQKEKEVSTEAINYAVELVKSGKTYVEAAKETSLKFNINISTSTVNRHCEKTNVSSSRPRTTITNKDCIDKYERLEAYNDRLTRLKKSINVGDKIDIASRGSSKVVEKYPNFVVCIIGGFREAIQYTEIKSILKQ